VLLAGDERLPLGEVLAAFLDELAVHQALGDHHVSHRVDHRHVAARGQGQVVGGLDVRRADQVDAPGSTTISLAPWRSRRFIREPNTGCPSVGFAPITMITSALATDLKSWVPAEVPKVCLSPYPVGEWQTRAQVSTLLLPNAARTIF